MMDQLEAMMLQYQSQMLDFYKGIVKKKKLKSNYIIR